MKVTGKIEDVVLVRQTGDTSEPNVTGLPPGVKLNLKAGQKPATHQTSPGQMLGDLSEPRRARWSLRLMWLGLVSMVVWASVAKIDQVTRAQAQLIAAARTQLVQSPDGGVVTKLHVKEGDEVQAGQLLVTLEKEEKKGTAKTEKVAKGKTKAEKMAARMNETIGKPLLISQGMQQHDLPQPMMPGAPMEMMKSSAASSHSAPPQGMIRSDGTVTVSFELQ